MELLIAVIIVILVVIGFYLFQHHRRTTIQLNEELEKTKAKLTELEADLERQKIENLRFTLNPHSFRNTLNTIEHLAKNNHLVYRVKELDVQGISPILVSFPSALSSICQLQALQRLKGILDSTSAASDQNNRKGEMLRRVKNLEEIS